MPRGTRFRRPAPTRSPFDMFAVMHELQKMQRDYLMGIAKVSAALEAFQRIKQGKPGSPGSPGRSVTKAEIEALSHRYLIGDAVEQAVKKILIQPKDGQSADARAVAQELLRSQKFLRYIKRLAKPGKPGDNADPVDTRMIIDTVLAELNSRPAFGAVPGLEARFAEVHNHIATKMRGGGDTVVAGTGVTITDTVNGNKKINAAGLSTWSIPPETPNSVITVFTVGASAPTDVVADAGNFYEGAGYTYAAGQITFTNPPTQYVRYR